MLIIFKRIYCILWVNIAYIDDGTECARDSESQAASATEIFERRNISRKWQDIFSYIFIMIPSSRLDRIESRVEGVFLKKIYPPLSWKFEVSRSVYGATLSSRVLKVLQIPRRILDTDIVSSPLFLDTIILWKKLEVKNSRNWCIPSSDQRSW